jgi:hypothetical protein
MGGEFAAAVYAAGFRLTSAVVAGESPGARSISGRQLLPFRVRRVPSAAAVVAAEPPKARERGLRRADGRARRQTPGLPLAANSGGRPIGE